jgi:hypothetical protein
MLALATIAGAEFEMTGVAGVGLPTLVMCDTVLLPPFAITLSPMTDSSTANRTKWGLLAFALALRIIGALVLPSKLLEPLRVRLGLLADEDAGAEVGVGFPAARNGIVFVRFGVGFAGRGGSRL